MELCLGGVEVVGCVFDVDEFVYCLFEVVEFCVCEGVGECWVGVVWWCVFDGFGFVVILVGCCFVGVDVLDEVFE